MTRFVNLQVFFLSEAFSRRTVDEEIKSVDGLGRQSIRNYLEWTGAGHWHKVSVYW